MKGTFHVMHTKSFILALALVFTLSWDSATALTINLGDNHDRSVERRRDERAREAYRDEHRRDGRRMHRDDNHNSIRRFFKRVDRSDTRHRRRR